jgi:hypothetical protein
MIAPAFESGFLGPDMPRFQTSGGHFFPFQPLTLRLSIGMVH